MQVVFMKAHEMRQDREQNEEIRERIKADRFPAFTVDGDNPPEDPTDYDDPTECIDGAGNIWPEHDESGYAECRRCGAELEV